MKLSNAAAKNAENVVEIQSSIIPRWCALHSTRTIFQRLTFQDFLRVGCHTGRDVPSVYHLGIKARKIRSIRIIICNSLSTKLNKKLNTLIVDVIANVSVTLIAMVILRSIKSTTMEPNSSWLCNEIRWIISHYQRSVLSSFLSFDSCDIR